LAGKLSKSTHEKPQPLSVAVTVNLHSLRLVQSSVAIHLTSVAPRENTEPVGGSQITSTFGEQLSVTVTLNLTGMLVHSIVTSPGHVIIGGTLSRTVMI
jgi:hypothetical protein